MHVVTFLDGQWYMLLLVIDARNIGCLSAIYTVHACVHFDCMLHKRMNMQDGDLDDHYRGIPFIRWKGKRQKDFYS